MSLIKMLQFSRHAVAQGKDGDGAGIGDREIDRRMLEALDDEIWSIGVSVAVVASYCNRLGEQELWRERRELMRWVPARPVVLPVVVDQLAYSRVSATAAMSFRALTERLGEAKARLEPLLGDAGPSPDQAPRGDIAGIWQDTASAALLALYERDHFAERLSYGLSLRASGPLAELLVAARDGKSELLGDNGVTLPAWVRRRQHRRIPLNADAVLQSRGTRHAVRVVDVARGGFGLDNAHDLAVDEVVALTLGSGRRFIGKVAWVNASRAGIRLASELPPSDPLIAAG